MISSMGSDFSIGSDFSLVGYNCENNFMLCTPCRSGRVQLCWDGDTSNYKTDAVMLKVSLM